ncbi:MAG: hypothetical protein U0446_05620 [Dehalococcoidia bacterium]
MVHSEERGAKLVEVPPPVQAGLDAVYEQALREFNDHRWPASFGLFHAAYDTLLREQPVGHRFHKGLPLHNMAVTAFIDQSIKTDLASSSWSLLAFLEDALTFAEGGGSNPLDLPAAKMLVYTFGYPGQALPILLRRVRELVDDGSLFQNPQDLAEVLSKENVFGPRSAPAPAARRKPGQYSSDWDRRVFVGASYKDSIAEVEAIAETCRSLGFDPIVEYEFEVSKAQVHHHALMLLHECRWAVFEVSSAAGQLMEIERARDYHIVPLVVFQGMSEYGRVASAMLEALLGRDGIDPKKYARIDELQSHVTNYLRDADETIRRESSS